MNGLQRVYLLILSCIIHRITHTKEILTTTAIVNKVNRHVVLVNKDKQFQQMFRTVTHHNRGQELVELNQVNKNLGNIRLTKEILIIQVRLVTLNCQDKEMRNNT